MSQYKFRINGKDYAVSVDSLSSDKAAVTVNDRKYDVDILEGGVSAAPAAAPAPKQEAPKAEAPKAPAAAGSKTIVSPLPGVIVELCVKEGQTVKSGAKVAVIEAMKMENDILAPKDGTITKVKVNKGDSVLEGAAIAEMS